MQRWVIGILVMAGLGVSPVLLDRPAGTAQAFIEDLTPAEQKALRADLDKEVAFATAKGFRVRPVRAWGIDPVSPARPGFMAVDFGDGWLACLDPAWIVPADVMKRVVRTGREDRAFASDVQVRGVPLEVDPFNINAYTIWRAGFNARRDMFCVIGYHFKPCSLSVMTRMDAYRLRPGSAERPGKPVWCMVDRL